MPSLSAMRCAVVYSVLPSASVSFRRVHRYWPCFQFAYVVHVVGTVDELVELPYCTSTATTELPTSPPPTEASAESENSPVVKSQKITTFLVGEKTGAHAVCSHRTGVDEVCGHHAAG